MINEEALFILKEEKDKLEYSRKKINEELRKVKNKKEYKAILTKKYGYNSEIAYIEKNIENKKFLKDYTIVDTPGMNQVLNDNIKHNIDNFYMQCDAILWIMDAQNIISKGASDVIERINKYQNTGSGNKKNILVINKMDLIKKEDRDKIEIKVNNLYEKIFDICVFISAKLAIEGYKNNDEKSIENSNIKRLEKSIEDEITKELMELKLNAKYKNIMILKNEILRKIKRTKMMEYLMIEEHEERIILLENQIEEYNKMYIDLIEKINK